MSIYVGNIKIDSLYLGNTSFSAVYVGNELVWAKSYVKTKLATPKVSQVGYTREFTWYPIDYASEYLIEADSLDGEIKDTTKDCRYTFELNTLYDGSEIKVTAIPSNTDKYEASEYGSIPYTSGFESAEISVIVDSKLYEPQYVVIDSTTYYFDSEKLTYTPSDNNKIRYTAPIESKDGPKRFESVPNTDSVVLYYGDISSGGDYPDVTCSDIVEDLENYHLTFYFDASST